MSEITRRTWLDWIGKSVVIALGSDLLASCAALGARDRVPADAAPPSADAACPAGAAPFAPGDGQAAIFRGWGERTVDEQDLAAILASWRLRVDGLVEAPASFGFADLLCLPRQEQTTDFHCVEGWTIYDVPWAGLHLSTLLSVVRPRTAASHVTIHTIGGTYNESLPLAVALEPRSLLAYAVAGSTLPLRHGFPLRMVVPRLLAYKNAKYVARLELTDRPTEGYWVAAGYPYAGEVPASRLRDGKW
jgi:DMSO/TMAO reductase YedYZ molybdopterin-dependent catalytic subunit